VSPRKHKIAVATNRDKNKQLRVGNFKTSEIKIAIRTYEDIYSSGRLKRRPGAAIWNFSSLKNVYFKRIPKDLKVGPNTPVGTLLWIADEFAERSRKPYILLKHVEPTEYDSIGGVDLREDAAGCPTTTKFYESVCIIPDKQRKKHVKKQEQSEEYIDKRKEELNAPKPSKEEVLLGGKRRKRKIKPTSLPVPIKPKRKKRVVSKPKTKRSVNPKPKDKPKKVKIKPKRVIKTKMKKKKGK